MDVPRVAALPPLTWVTDLLFGDWPDGSETGARQASGVLRAMAASLDTLADNGTAAAYNVNDSAASVATEEFNNFWYSYVRDIRQTAGSARKVADYLLDFALQIEYTKWTINIQIVLLLVQLAYDFLLAPYTLGLSMGEAILSVVLTRGVVRFILSRLLESVLMMVVPDLGAQLIQMATGSRHELDFGKLGSSLQTALVAGGLGVLAAPLFRGAPSRWLTRALGAGTGEVVTAALEGAAVNVGTEVANYYISEATGGHPSGGPLEDWWRAAMQGAAFGAIMHGLNKLQSGDRRTAAFYDSTGTPRYTGVEHPDGGYTLWTPGGRLAGHGTLSDEGVLTIGTPGEQAATLIGIDRSTTVTVGQASFTGQVRTEPMPLPDSQAGRPTGVEYYTYPVEPGQRHHPAGPGRSPRGPHRQLGRHDRLPARGHGCQGHHLLRAPGRHGYRRRRTAAHRPGRQRPVRQSPLHQQHRQPGLGGELGRHLHAPFPCDRCAGGADHG